MMRFQHGAALLMIAIAASACDQSGSVSLDSNDSKASYAIGQDIGRNLKPAAAHIDMDAFLKGIEDMMNDVDPALPPEELQAAIQEFSQAVTEEQEAERVAQAETNLADGVAYMAENGAKEGVITTESGLQYEVMREGDGAMPTDEDQVSINYSGSLVDGTEFDSSYERGVPATFSVNGVIAGFTEALMLMNVGGQIRVVIPGSLGYGPGGSGELIGPNATLIFEIELLEIPE
jgi:FKBP-type peptidyl-prolyl cis-trans isomerase